MAPISNASRLAEFGSGIGTDGAVIQVDNSNKRVGIGTTNPQATLQVGTGVSVYGNVGIVSATEVRADTLRGDGSNITGVVGVGTLNVRTETVTTSGVSTFAGVTKVTDTTDATSTTTGALIISGGVGIAKSLHVGQNITIGGTLTYEDVTNVDSIGVVTARSGVNVSGGQLLVGSGVTIGNAGVATFSGTADVHLHDNVKLLVGDSSDLQIYNDGTNNYIKHTTAGAVYVETTTNLNLRVNSNENAIVATANEDVSLYYNASKKFETTNDGTVTTGISTVDGLRLGDNEYISVGAGGTGDLQISHNGTNSIINNTTGELRIQTDAGMRMMSTGFVVTDETNSDTIINAQADGAVSLYYDNSVKFATNNDGTVTTGIGTFTGGVMLPDGSSTATRIGLGDAKDLLIFHNGSHSYIQNATGQLRIQSDTLYLQDNANSHAYVTCVADGAVGLRYDNVEKLATTNDGVVVSGMTTSVGVAYTGLLRESFAKTDGRLSANTNIDLEKGMVHYFTTAENTTSTPNIRWNSSISLNNKMNINDAITVTIISAAAAAGYSAQLNIDSSGVTEQWVGGEAPDEGGANGYDIYTYNILKTANATFFVIAHVVNAT